MKNGRKWEVRFMDALERYDRMARRASRQVIGTYSTSFGLSAALLPRAMRRDIANLYAVVRVADEIVDGAAPACASRLLDAYEEQICAAPGVRFHTDPIVHAYAATARRCGFKEEHLRAFFASMRADLTPRAYSPAKLAQYIYGSAEVIGLLCLAIFFADEPMSCDREHLETGARHLGAGFQKANFLRDLREDTERLGRAYYPATVTVEEKAGIVASIRKDFAIAEPTVRLLPRGARVAVTAAYGIYSRLTEQLDAMTPEELLARRASVPTWEKAAIVARAVARG